MATNNHLSCVQCRVNLHNVSCSLHNHPGLWHQYSHFQEGRKVQNRPTVLHLVVKPIFKLRSDPRSTSLTASLSDRNALSNGKGPEETPRFPAASGLLSATGVTIFTSYCLATQIRNGYGVQRRHIRPPAALQSQPPTRR